jgi:predicted nucleic acid-binding protein
MDGIAQRLSQHRLVTLDTPVFIYHLESHLVYGRLAYIVLAGLQAGQYQGVTSVVTLMELTVRPWRARQELIARKYEAVVTRLPNLHLADITRMVARQAAQLRARFALRPADALQVATALNQKATAFITNDAELRRLAPLLDVIVLKDFALTNGATQLGRDV